MENRYSIEEKIVHIKEAILKHVPAKYIYLFGSYAYGEPEEHSDIDIYAVLPDHIEKERMHRIKIRRELANINIFDVDLHLNNESSFNKRKHISRFEETIFEKGRLLYENP